MKFVTDSGRDIENSFSIRNRVGINKGQGQGSGLLRFHCMPPFRKIIHQVCYSEGFELRIRFFDSATEAHNFAREHEPSIPGQTTAQVESGDVHKPLAEILAAMNSEDRLDWAVATAARD